MLFDNGFLIWLVMWLVIAAAILCLQTRQSSHRVGLVLAYVFSLWLIHWLAAAMYVLPWYSNFNTDDVLAGLQQSTYAVAAFGVGSLLLSPLVRKIFSFPPATLPRTPSLRTTRIYIIAGLVFYLLLGPLLSGPTITAVVTSGGSLITAGLVLKSWSAWKSQDRREFSKSLGLSLGLPFLTLITSGFIGYGTSALILVWAAVASFYRPRWKVLLVGVLSCYLGLSIYVTYMRDRTEVREVIWGGESYTNRFQVLYQTFGEFELFDPYDPSHLDRIDRRLNQSALVGMAIRNMETGHQEFAQGETIVDAAFALVPRAIWRDKPVTGGSGNIVSKYTGIVFAEGTSVGVGPVLEFYINFGTMGVVIGFLIMGAIVGLIDEVAGERMLSGDWQGFIFWFLPGIAFLQVGGQLAEVTSSAAGALILAFLVKRLVFGRLRAVDEQSALVVSRRAALLTSSQASDNTTHFIKSRR